MRLATSPGRFRRARVLFRCLLPAILLLLPHRAHAQDPLAAFEQGVFEVAVERLPPLTTLALVDSAGSVLLPVGALAEHLGFALERTARSWSVPRLRGVGVLQLDVRALIADPDTLRLAPAEMVVTADEVYLRTDRIARYFDATATVDFARLTVVLSREPPFPAQQRIELEQRRALLRGRTPDAPKRESRFDATLHTGIGTLDWDLATNGLDPTRLTFARLQLGGAVLGGGLTTAATFQLGRDATRSVRDRTLRYHRVFAQPWLEQVEAGGIMTHGLYARFIDGAEITNAPYLHDYDLGEIVLDPELPAGWQYEVVQGPQLLGYSEPGQRPVAVPLRTGATPVEVRMFGPAGEEVVERLTFQTPVGLLPRGRVQYVLGGGRCRDTSCDNYGHADVRWGGWSRITLGAGAELLSDTLGRELRPYLVSSFTTGTELTGEVHVMPDAAYRGSFAAYLGEKTTARASAGLARPGYRRVAALAAAGHRWDVDLNVDRQLAQPLFGARALRFSVAGIGQRGERPQRWSFGITTSQASGFTEARLETANTAPDVLSLRATRSVARSVGSRTLRPSLTAAAGAGRVGVRYLEAGTLVQPLQSVAVSAALQWTREGGAGFSIAWNSRIGPVQATVRTAAARNSDPTSALGLGGSLALSPPHHLHAEPISRTGYGGARGVVFLDRDGDLRPDPDEPVVPGLPLQVGSQLATTDSAGRFIAWGLFPYVRTTIAVDSLRIADPSWTLARPFIEVVPSPNAATRVDVPLVQTRELAGSLTADAPIRTTSGVTLVITAADGTTTTAVTFSDGTFYVSRLRPGRYTLDVAAAALDALDARTAAPLAFTIPAGGDEPLVELPPLRLLPR